MSLAFSERARAEIDRLLARYPTRGAATLPVLRVAEREFGGIDDDVMVLVADTLDLSPAQVRGVFSFYTHLRRPGWGKYVLQVCATLSCALRGCEGLADHLEARLGIRAGQTTPDRRFTLLKVECLARCGESPVLQVNDDMYVNVTPAKADAILESLP
ncbi:MAG: NAD(P)H-dependent oxidoreductase subunit E [Planctomycetes bacterium]|nr:NAD(P)H-dependent oxidoreductase subunit E [Planctomycetota bacterium]